MPDLVYGISSFERQRGNFPSLPVVNMLAETVETESSPALQSRPGMEFTNVVMGSGPVTGLFSADGVLNNKLFGVSASSLYQNNTLIGAIDGNGPISFGGYADKVFVNAGASLWVFNGNSLSVVNFPDKASVSKIVVGASRLIAIKKDTGVFYWSDPLKETIDPLNFATAENSPDSLQDMLFLGDRLILFGKETVEFWPIQENNNTPFAPLVGAVFPVGIKGTGMAALFNRSFAWITNYNEVCVSSPDSVISDPQLQIKIAQSSNPRLWIFYVDEHEYLAVTLDNETWVYGARTKVWSQLATVDKNNWRAQCYSSGYFGLTDSGNLAKWSDDYSDFGKTLERRFRAWAELTTGTILLNSITLRTNPGTTPYISGNYTDPIVELRTSRDGGKEWQPWRQKTLGRQGAYLKQTVWTSLGQFGYPGLLIELRVNDPVPFRISGLVFNEPLGGR